jgi:uncharacterized RDD family membrane protein YckC
VRAPRILDVAIALLLLVAVSVGLGAIGLAGAPAAVLAGLAAAAYVIVRLEQGATEGRRSLGRRSGGPGKGGR